MTPDTTYILTSENSAATSRTETIPDANRARRNKLSPHEHPLVIDVDQQQQQQSAGFTPRRSLMYIERVRKCALRITTDKLTTLKSREKSRKIYQSLANEDNAITTVVYDCDDAPDSEAAVRNISSCFLKMIECIQNNNRAKLWRVCRSGFGDLLCTALHLYEKHILLQK